LSKAEQERRKALRADFIRTRARQWHRRRFAFRTISNIILQIPLWASGKNRELYNWKFPIFRSRFNWVDEQVQFPQRATSCHDLDLSSTQSNTQQTQNQASQPSAAAVSTKMTASASAPNHGIQSTNTTTSTIQVHTSLPVVIEKPFTCTHPNCGKGFVDEASTKKHYSLAHGMTSFICRIAGCGLRFNDRLSLTRHQMEIHRKKEKKEEKPEMALEDTSEFRSVPTDATPQMTALNKKIV
jgi:hypothetical protein